jgi:hypothetical protein
MSPVRLLPVLAIALSCLGGCQKAADAATEAAIERASGAKVDIQRDGDAVTIQTAEGELAMQSGDALPLPDGFPEDVHLPDDYVVNSIMDMGGAQVVGMTAAGSVGSLFADARTGMARSGWKQVMAMQHSADSAMLSFEKDARTAVLSFNQDDAADGVQVSVQLHAARQ